MKFNKFHIAIIGTVVLFLVGGLCAFQYSKVKQEEELNVEWTPTARCQWDIGGVPMDFEKIADFKTIKTPKGDRVMYQFTMNNGEIRKIHVGSTFTIRDITNEVRVCTKGRGLGLGLLF